MLLFGLFLGYPIEDDFAEVLESVDPQVSALFITQESSEYLQEIIHNDRRYLGKFTGEAVGSQELILLESNIYSLLKKIVPNYPYDRVPLVLFSHEYSLK